MSEPQHTDSLCSRASDKQQTSSSARRCSLSEPLLEYVLMLRYTISFHLLGKQAEWQGSTKCKEKYIRILETIRTNRKKASQRRRRELADEETVWVLWPFSSEVL